MSIIIMMALLTPLAAITERPRKVRIYRKAPSIY